MAVFIEEINDDSEEIPSLETLLVSIRVPLEYARYATIEDSAVLDRLATWKAQATGSIHALLDALLSLTALTVEESAHVVCAVAPFLSDREWSSEEAATAAREIMSFFDVQVPLLEAMLSSQIKPAFQATRHPMLNADTGRALSRPAGGPMAAHDMYEGQMWKSYPGIDEALVWCLERIPTDAYEHLWYLAVPPTMTLLDDYEALHKLSGTRAVRALIGTAPPDLLRRTGVANLIFASLKRALTLLHSPDTPALLRAACSAAVTLVVRTCSAGSASRFEQLCELLGDALIGSVWIYAYNEPDAIKASIDALPQLLDALGLGAVRYLKALIPQLTHALQPLPTASARPSLQLTSLRALRTVVRVCAPRMYHWKGYVLDGAARCWVALADAGADDDVSNKIREELRAVCLELEEVVPGVREDYKRLLDLDRDIFGSLFILSAQVPAEPARPL